MPINKEHIDELYSRVVGNMEVTPPENGWQRIERKLNRDRLYRYKYLLAAASVLLLMGTAATFVYLTRPDKDAIPAIAETAVSVPAHQSAALPETPAHVSPETNGTIASVSQQTNAGRKTRPAREKEETAETQADAGSPPIPTQSAAPTAAITSATPETFPVAAISTVSTGIPATPFYDDALKQTKQSQLLEQQRFEFMMGKLLNKPAPLPATRNSAPPMIAAVPDDDWDPFGEEEKTKKKPANKWEISGQFAPTYSYRNITAVPADMRRSDFDDAESALLAYSGGINVSYKVMDRLSVQMGVYYTQMGQTINKVTPSYNMYASISSNNAYSKNFLHTSSGNATVTSNVKTDVNENYANYFNGSSIQGAVNSASLTAKSAQYSLIERFDYVEIPMLVRYKLIDRKVDFLLLGGMSANILVDNNVFIDNGSELIKDGSILLARPVNYNSTVGLGMNYQVSKNLVIGVEPIFKYFLQSYTSKNTIDSHPYSFGLYTGVYYSF
ncbi:MAG: hypothetical protein LBS03_05180 [Bacteroidales bacterium]|jgi:hypothetical protein|nr:hypothetical protein [Bacteroidales bacterium]